ncbi:formate-dependent phosphoribosylglycinamide formyltransferase [Mycolicibacterium sediminis]|uniref:Phosphoribosylglycinamide formyltransferase 2 n=1 Tax=Mycolicibacterium sediminis TaxID=1286180 RepID=A0A7I7QN15_9MYCO|nr:phosphoribosylglycinamide formyltransferase 2 [Mycolicibacterium sediminis]
MLLLGSAVPGGDLALAFERLGAVVTTVDPADTSHDGHDFVVADSPQVPADVLIAAAERDGVEVFPTPRSARLSLDREGLRKLAADELGLPTVPFWFAGSAEELDAVAEHAGFPLVVSPVAGDAAGGRSILTRPDDVGAAWQLATSDAAGGPGRVIAETVVDIDDEVTLLTVRTIGPTGPAVHFCEPIGHRRTDGGPLEAWQPHHMAPAALDAARSIAARIVNSLGGRGLFGVDLLVSGDEVYFSHVRPRPEAVGLVTLRSQRLSQFELHARAILGLSIDTIMISPAAAEVIDRDGAAPGMLNEALAVPESDVRLVDGAAVAVATAPDVVRARDRAHRVSSVLRVP